MELHIEQMHNVDFLRRMYVSFATRGDILNFESLLFWVIWGCGNLVSIPWIQLKIPLDWPNQIRLHPIIFWFRSFIHTRTTKSMVFLLRLNKLPADQNEGKDPKNCIARPSMVFFPLENQFWLLKQKKAKKAEDWLILVFCYFFLIQPQMFLNHSGWFQVQPCEQGKFGIIIILDFFNWILPIFQEKNK